MINFIVKLEDMLKMSGYEDWEIRYLPEEKAYALKLDDDIILMKEIVPMSKFFVKENERTDI